MTYSRNMLKTCPICGWRERRPDCVIGKDCRQRYNDVAATAVANGEQVVDIFVFAEIEGGKTLKRLREKLQEAKNEKKKMRDMFWNRASIQLQANLARQSSTFRMTEGIHQQAMVQIFRNLYGEDEKYQTLSTKTHGIGKAIESLQHYLDVDLPRMHKECKERIEAEKVGAA